MAKMAASADLSHYEPALRRKMQEVKSNTWDIPKVRAMSTEQIERQLLDCGVEHNRERFLQLSQGLTSAWSLCEFWFEQDKVTCKGLDEDFLGFAACELWRRWIPERPSMEMIDDWLEQGYELVNQDVCAACEHWWQAWRALQPRFQPHMRTTMETRAVYQGSYLIFNWCQDFEQELSNASLRQRRFASQGQQYCREWLAQFDGEKPGMQLNFRRALAEFTLRAGQVEQARLLLEENLSAYPNDPWAHIALADAYSHLMADPDYHLPFDLEKARGYLQNALQRFTQKSDVRDLKERLEMLSEAVPVTDKTALKRPL